MSKKIRIGVICPSEIAYRRFLPALMKADGVEYAGVAVATPQEWAGGADVTQKTIESVESEYAKAEKFKKEYGGRIFDGYNTMIESDEIDAVYLPLPPSLHAKWAEKTLLAGKHAYVEKPFTTSYIDTERLVHLAHEKGLALHENYMFIYHSQLKEIAKVIASGDLGKVRLYRITFGFPLRPAGDFRYLKALGGGALLDAGGYCIKLASGLLGASAELKFSQMNFEPEFEVDIFGSGVMCNTEGQSVQFAFGMDCDYMCNLEVWGSKGTLTTGRILTAPDGYEPEITIKHNQIYETKKLPEDRSFLNSIHMFVRCVDDPIVRKENYKAILRQGRYVEQFKEMAENGK